MEEMSINLNQILTGFFNAIGYFLKETFFGSIILAIIIIALTWLFSFLVVRLINKKVRGSKTNVLDTSFFTNMIRALIWFVGIAVLFAVCLEIDIAGIIAALGVGGIAISLGMQDTIGNVMGGMYLNFSHLFYLGDRVRFDDDEGTIKDITWRHTIIKLDNGDEMIVPNLALNKSSITLVHSHKSNANDERLENDELEQASNKKNDNSTAGLGKRQITARNRADSGQKKRSCIK